MPSEKEQAECLSQTNDDEVDACTSEDESSSFFLEYHVPLEDSTGTDRRSRVNNESSKGSNSRSFGNCCASIRESDHVTNHGEFDHLNPEDERKVKLQHNLQYHDISVRDMPQCSSAQSASFNCSTEKGFVTDNSYTIRKENRHQHTRSKQKKIMEIRMDGNVKVTQSNDSKNLDLIHIALCNKNSVPVTCKVVDSDGVDDGMKSGSGGDHRCSRNQQEASFGDSIQGITGCLNREFSFNINSSTSPTIFHPSSSQNNFSAASSEQNFLVKPSSCSINGAVEQDQGAMIPEEKNAVADYFDDSDASSTMGTGLTRRIKGIFNLHRISISIVKFIPYFCLCCFKNKNEIQGSTFPDRFILARLNILSFFFSIVQLAASLWLIVVLFFEGTTNTDGAEYPRQFYLWNNNGSVIFIGCLAFILVITCFWTTRIVKEVDLVGALRFLWLLLWILPVAAFFNITAFDYHEVTSIWIRHNWNSVQLSWFRKHLCSPGTAGTLCMVPIEGGLDYDSEDEWCIDQYNITVCTEIRDEAQTRTTFILLIFYRSLASWGCIYMFVMLLIIKSLERIISKPMVQKSREVNVVTWLSFPIFCTALYGSIILFSPHTYLDKLIQPRCVL